MTRVLAFLASLAVATAGEPLLQQSKFDAGDPAWRAWSARAEIAPKTSVDAAISRGGSGSLRIDGAGNAAAAGGWERTVSGVTPGAWYQFRAYYRAKNVPSENWQVLARLEWVHGDGTRAGQPEFLSWNSQDGEWIRLENTFPAPAGASAAKVQLWLLNGGNGSVWWDDLSLEKVAAPSPRKITVASVNLKPDRTGSAEESVRQFLVAIERSVPKTADLIVLPEGITVVGTGKTYPEVAETVPGPTTRRLGEVAKARKAYVAAGIYERDGNAIYNTAVLLDRNGELAGKYRKVYLPREEVERGLTPGSEFPVFRTDFGTVGMMICYDVFFADPARALASRGADVIAMPIWGGDETLAKARAIENKVFLVASGYDHPTYIMDPDGERLSEARERGTVAVSTIDLNRLYTDKWLGDMRTRRLRELRLDAQRPAPGRVP